MSPKQQSADIRIIPDIQFPFKAVASSCRFVFVLSFLMLFFPRLLLKHDKHFPFSISALSMKKSLLVWILFCCLKKLNAAFNGVAASSYLQHREGPPQAFSSNLIVIKTHKINFLSRAKQILVTYASRDKATLPSKKCNKFLIFLFTLMCCWKTKYDTGRNGAVIHQNP